MAWIDNPQLFTILKPHRPLIDIPNHAHPDPLRTPEDPPLRVPWISSDPSVYHLTTFAVDHDRFPDVPDAGWAMQVSPPSPSRRTSLQLLPDISSKWDIPPQSPSRRNSLQLPPEFDTDLDDPPVLSPPSPSIRCLPGLPSPWPPPAPESDFDCPQLSPPSPFHPSTALPSLELETHSLFIEDVPPPSPYDFSTPRDSDSPIRAEHRALVSLRDRTLYSEHTSRARNKALRGRERELGRAVAELSADEELHAFRAAATRVMLERTEEKRRRKKDKERLKELRVLLGTGVDALLRNDAANVHPEDGLLLTPAEGASAPTTDLGNNISGLGLGLALHAPEDDTRVLAERTHVMRRLAASMTMRRRDMGMRGLLEASTEVSSLRPPSRRSGLAHAVSVPGDDQIKDPMAQEGDCL